MPGDRPVTTRRATRLKKTGDYVDDPHITCLDTFSLTPVPVSHAPGPLESFCQIPSDNPHREGAPTITLAPGVDVLDFYATSEKVEIWKDNACLQCLVPHVLVGWEFYTLLHPRPDGSAPVTLNPDSNGPSIELLFGRPPGAQQFPSMLFIVVPEGQQYQSHTSHRRTGPPGRARGAGPQTPYSCEKACANLDARGCSLRPRLLALCPTQIYDASAVLPDGAGWGLFIGPRHRMLVLLNRQRGRIDVQLAMLFSADAVFQRGQALINATARLYEPFGTAEAAAALFQDFDPLKAHCGFTNAVIADHVNAGRDGRDDYRRLLGVWPQSFFVSNSSDNLRFLTPFEVQRHRTRDGMELPEAVRLEDFPRWVIAGGEFDHDARDALRKYRTHVIPYGTKAQRKEGWGGGVMQLLGLHKSGPADDALSQMVAKLGGCAEVTFAGTQPWEEPGGVIDARPAVDKGGGDKAGSENDAAAAGLVVPGWVDTVLFGEEPQVRGQTTVHWRHSLDLVPGGLEQTPRASSRRSHVEGDRRSSKESANAQKETERAQKEQSPDDDEVMRRWSGMPDAYAAALPPPT